MKFLNLSHLKPLEAVAEKVAKLPEVQAAMAEHGWISMNVCAGRCDLQFRKSAEGWVHRSSYVDHCFGNIVQKWQPLKLAA